MSLPQFINTLHLTVSLACSFGYTTLVLFAPRFLEAGVSTCVEIKEMAKEHGDLNPAERRCWP